MADLPDNVLQFPGPGKRHIDEELARGRKPLYVDRGRGRVSDRPGDPVAAFGTRLAKIRMSIAKCNELMAELRKSASPEIRDPETWAPEDTQ